MCLYKKPCPAHTKDSYLLRFYTLFYERFLSNLSLLNSEILYGGYTLDFVWCVTFFCLGEDWMFAYTYAHCLWCWWCRACHFMLSYVQTIRVRVCVLKKRVNFMWIFRRKKSTVGNFTEHTLSDSQIRQDRIQKDA